MVMILKTFIVVEKAGTLNECSVDSLENLYKKCGLRKSEDFKKIAEYTFTEDDRLELWGRSVGRNTTKNPFSFKFDTTLQVYGPAAIVCIKKGTMEHLTIGEYTKLEAKATTTTTSLDPDPDSSLEPEPVPVSVYKTDQCKETKKETMCVNKAKSEVKSEAKSDAKSEAKSEVKSESENESENNSDSELEFDEYVYSSEEEVEVIPRKKKTNK